MEEKNPIQVADRLFLTVEILAADGPARLMELSKKLELNKTTVHRILNSLIYMGYVKQDSVSLKYSLTFKIWEVANQLLTKIDMVDIARPHLKKLVEDSGETVHLVEKNGVNAVYIDKVESYTNSVRLVSKVGESIPLYCSGVGKAILADMEDDAIRAIWKSSQIQKLTDHTIISLDEFMKKITQIRKLGYALDDEENEMGVRCIAACLRDYRGKAKYAFSISAPVNRMDEARLLQLANCVLATKESISQEIH